MMNKRWCREAHSWGGIAGSSVFGLVVQQIPGILTLVFVGRVSLAALAAISITAVWSYGIAEIIWVGLSITQSALCAQAAGGRAYVAVYGWTLIRGFFAAVTSLLILLPVWLTTHLVLEKIGFSDVDLSIVQEYLGYSLPVPFMVSFLEGVAVHLVSIQRLWQPVVGELVFAVLDVAFSYVLVLGADFGGGRSIPAMGVRGAALANVISCGACLLLYSILFYCFSMPPPQLDEEDEGDGAEVEEVDADVLARAAASPLILAHAQAHHRTPRLLALNAGTISHSHHLRPHRASTDGADVPTLHAPACAAASGAGGGGELGSPLLLDEAFMLGATAPREPSPRTGYLKSTTGLQLLPAGGAPPADAASFSVNAVAATADSAAGNGEKERLLRRERSVSSAASASSSSASAAHEAAVRAVSWRAVWAFATRGRNLRTFAVQAGSNTLTMALEIGQSQLLSFLAADLGAAQVAAHNSLTEVFELGGMVLYGLGEATSIRVGYHLGHANPRGAQRVVGLALAVAGLWALACAGAFAAAGAVIGRAFSDDDAVVAAAAGIAPWMAGSYCAYSLYITLSTVLDGQGRATVNPLVSFVGCWALTGTLAGLSMRFTAYGLPALWGAEMVGNAGSALVTAVLVYRSDWRGLSLQAIERSELEEEPEDSRRIA